ncbi:MAG: FAD-dependent oxidoreductase, partial [Pseudomonadota bacterium]
QLHARALVIAAGCFDLPVVFPGWNLPGVMSAGGIQAFIKSQQFVPGERFLLAGSHPLQLVVADQIVQAGGSVAGVLFSQRAGRALALLRHPSVVLRNADKLIQTAAILRRLRAAGVPVRFNRTLLRANGRDSLQSVTTVPVGPAGELGRDAADDVACDRLGVCFGFLTSSELARQAGVACVWDAARGGWIARHDGNMSSDVPGIYVAGETTGVAGSDVAALEGRLSGIACAGWLGKIDGARVSRLSSAPRRALERRNRFARLLGRLAWPGTGLFDELMTDSATLCKCEELTVGQLKTLLRRHPDTGTASSAKLLSRAGMGLCQGRYCHFALTRVLARHLGVTDSEIGGFTARFPSKPVLIENLIDGAPD